MEASTKDQNEQEIDDGNGKIDTRVQPPKQSTTSETQEASQESRVEMEVLVRQEEIQSDSQDQSHGRRQSQAKSQGAGRKRIQGERKRGPGTKDDEEHDDGGIFPFDP